MAQVINFAALPTQGDPFQASLAKTIQDAMFSIPMAQQELRKNQLANAISQAQAQYAQPMEEAKLSQAQALPQLTQAQAGLTNEQAKYYGPEATSKIQLQSADAQAAPFKAMGEYYSGIGKLRGNSSSAQASRLLNNPQMQALIQNNPEVGKQVSILLGNIVNSANSAGASGPVPLQQNNGAVGKPVQGNPYPNQSNGLTVSPTDILKLANAGIGVPGGAQNSGFTPTPDDVAKVQRAAGDALIARTETAAQKNQKLYANTLDQIFDAAQPTIPSVVKYSGILGQLKGNAESAESQLRKSSPQDFKNYQDFTTIYAPHIANEIRRALGGQATDNEQKLMSTVANPVSWQKSPEVALQNWNTLLDLYRNHINSSLTQTPSETQSSLTNTKFNSTNGDPLSLKR